MVLALLHALRRGVGAVGVAVCGAGEDHGGAGGVAAGQGADAAGGGEGGGDGRRGRGRGRGSEDGAGEGVCGVDHDGAAGEPAAVREPVCDEDGVRLVNVVCALGAGAGVLCRHERQYMD